jgi:hypothetical protein
MRQPSISRAHRRFLSRTTEACPPVTPSLHRSGCLDTPSRRRIDPIQRTALHLHLNPAAVGQGDDQMRFSGPIRPHKCIGHTGLHEPGHGQPRHLCTGQRHRAATARPTNGRSSHQTVAPARSVRSSPARPDRSPPSPALVQSRNLAAPFGSRRVEYRPIAPPPPARRAPSPRSLSCVLVSSCLSRQPLPHSRSRPVHVPRRRYLHGQPH